MTPSLRIAFVVLACAASAAEAAPAPRAPAGQQPPPLVRPGAPGQPARVVTPEEARDVSHVRYTDADVRFMQGMIAHHAQAVEMVGLLKTHTTDPDMRKLGQRIELSQTDEMKMMRHWLEARGQSTSVAHAMPMDAGTPMLMPGMLTPAEMARLAAATGPAFDRLFLEGMIKHHGGALTMVKRLFGTAGAGQESDIFAFASEVETDQRMEIARMSAMLEERQQ